MVYGIDLGTTYSCIAKYDGKGDPSIIPPTSEKNSNSLPSIVQFKPDGKIVVGSSAKHSATRPDSASQVLSLFKRQMGLPFCGQSIQTNEETCRRVSPIEGSACILRKLIDPIVEANRAIGDEKKPRAVISIPTGFTGWQRAATKMAAELAGIEVLGLVHEPTAAALSFDINAGERVLVFDLGGGTLDVSVVHHFEPGKFRVLASASDFEVLGHYLGGQDWDKQIALKIAEQYDINIDFDNVAEGQRYLKARLMNEAEKAKIFLSNNDLYANEITGYDDTFEISQTVFTNSTQFLTLDCIRVVDEAISRSGLSEAELRDMRLITVGGSSNMRMIRDVLVRNYGGRIGRGPEKQWFPVANPSQAIAQGAAKYAFLLDTNQASIYELSSHSYGTVCKICKNNKEEFFMDNLIMRSDSMVCKKELNFTPHFNGQNAVPVDIWENEQNEERFPFNEEKQRCCRDRRIFYEDYCFSNPKNVTTETLVHFTVKRDESGLMSLIVTSDNGPRREYKIQPLSDTECSEIRDRLKNVQ